MVEQINHLVKEGILVNTLLTNIKENTRKQWTKYTVSNILYIEVLFKGGLF